MPIYNSSKGPIEISEMNDQHLDNAIRKMERTGENRNDPSAYYALVKEKTKREMESPTK